MRPDLNGKKPQTGASAAGYHGDFLYYLWMYRRLKLTIALFDMVKIRRWHPGIYSA
jgi:hypothetical protein